MSKWNDILKIEPYEQAVGEEFASGEFNHIEKIQAMVTKLEEFDEYLQDSDSKSNIIQTVRHLQNILKGEIEEINESEGRFG